jgi:hypothetical protein
MSDSEFCSKSVENKLTLAVPFLFEKRRLSFAVLW